MTRHYGGGGVQMNYHASAETRGIVDEMEKACGLVDPFVGGTTAVQVVSTDIPLGVRLWRLNEFVARLSSSGYGQHMVDVIHILELGNYLRLPRVVDRECTYFRPSSRGLQRYS
jgi:hypothetical protein